MITRFLEPTETSLLKTVFDNSPRALGENLTPESIDEWCTNITRGIERGFKKCAITTSEDGEVLCIVIGTEYNSEVGWLLGLVKVRTKKKELSENFPIIAKTMDYMIAYMESRGIYKFWENKLLPERKYISGRKILSTYSKFLQRYERTSDYKSTMNNKNTVIWWSHLRPEYITGADGGD